MSARMSASADVTAPRLDLPGGIGPGVGGWQGTSAQNAYRLLRLAMPTAAFAEDATATGGSTSDIHP